MNFSAILNFLSPLISAAAGKFGIVVQILVIIGMFRAVMKVVFTAADQIVAITPGKGDDQVLGDIERSRVYKTASFILDYLCSIKLPK